MPSAAAGLPWLFLTTSSMSTCSDAAPRASLPSGGIELGLPVALAGELAVVGTVVVDPRLKLRQDERLAGECATCLGQQVVERTQAVPRHPPFRRGLGRFVRLERRQVAAQFTGTGAPVALDRHDRCRDSPAAVLPFGRERANHPRVRTQIVERIYFILIAEERSAAQPLRLLAQAEKCPFSTSRWRWSVFRHSELFF